MRHFIEPNSFSLEEQLALLDLADRMEADPAPYAHLCDGRILATLFYEPSTRTRLSFESAMLRLGGKTLGFAGAQLSSASKGETVEDTARVVSNYADVIAMRHPKEGAPLRASRYSRIPVINAGDGGHQHPTQTLTDLMTIRRRKGRLDDLTIGLCGDLKFGRTVHSLIKTMARCRNIRFVLISPEELRVPDYIIKDVLEAKGIEVIFDDRKKVSPGVKFKDAELIGVPLVAVAGRDTVNNGTIEVRDRNGENAEAVPVADAAQVILSLIHI